MPSSSDQRLIVLIDMDCFFCQVETRLQPEYIGKPLAVVQYNQWQLGGIIAVNYKAREFGVTRHMRGQEAKEKCPELILASVPCLRGKSDTSRYRNAGREVINVISKHCSVIERASVDEAYLDITSLVDERINSMSLSLETLKSQLSNTYIIGYSTIGKNDENERRSGINTWLSDIFNELQDVHSQRLAVAGAIVEELRADILEKTGFKCSAGISQNKILAKLACGLHKPNQQTILPAAAVSNLYSTLPVKQVRNLGGKFGDIVIESLGCNVMGDLLQYPLQYLQKRFDEKTGSWLYKIARGIDNEPVTTRLVSKSIGVCKKFPGKQAIVTLDVLKHWSGQLAEEVCERLEQDLEENKRRATLLTVCFHYYQNRNTVTQSRSCPLTSYKPEKMLNQCVDIITKSTECPIAYIGLSAGKFVPSKGSGTFMSFFKNNKGESSESQVDNKSVSCSIRRGQSEPNEILETQIVTRTDTKDKLTAKQIPNTAGSLLDQDNISEECKSKNVQGIKRVEGTFIVSETVEESPTSRKVNTLVNKLGKSEDTNWFNNQAHSINKKISMEIRDNTVRNELNPDNFKESFFMNIFKEKHTNSVNNGQHADSMSQKQTTENSLNIVDECGKHDIDKNEVVLEENADSTAACNDSDPLEDRNDLTSASAKVVSGELDDIHCSIQLSHEGLARNNTSSTVRLQDIFPDLNDMDPSIVSLLPIDLQAEAKSYLNARSSFNHKSTDTNAKNSKGRAIKSRSNTTKKKKNGPISNFLVKRVTHNLIDGPLKMCTKCNNMIPVTKYAEHSDFHLAQNLQNEINRNLSNNVGTKRKHDVLGPTLTSAKRSNMKIC